MQFHPYIRWQLKFLYRKGQVPALGAQKDGTFTKTDTAGSTCPESYQDIQSGCFFFRGEQAMKLAQWWSWEFTVKTNSEAKAKLFCSAGLGLPIPAVFSAGLGRALDAMV